MNLAHSAIFAFVVVACVESCSTPKAVGGAVGSARGAESRADAPSLVSAETWVRPIDNAVILEHRPRSAWHEAEAALLRGDQGEARAIARRSLRTLLELGRFDDTDPRTQELYNLSRLLDDTAQSEEDTQLAGRAYERWRDCVGGGSSLARQRRSAREEVPVAHAPEDAPASALDLPAATLEASNPHDETLPAPVMAENPTDPAAPKRRGIDEELLEDNEQRVRNSIETATRIYGAGAPEVITQQLLLARLLASKKRFIEARAEYEAILAAYEKWIRDSTVPVSGDLVRGQVEAGLEYSKTWVESGDPTKALAAASSAVDVAAGLPADDPIRDEAFETKAQAADDLARAREGSGDLVGAQSALQAALDARKQVRGAREAGLQLSIDRLGALLRIRNQKAAESQQQGDTGAAEAARAEILEGARSLPPENSVRFEFEEARIAELQQACRLNELAVLRAQRVKDLEQSGARAAIVDESRRELAALLRVLGRQDEARLEEALLGGR